MTQMQPGESYKSPNAVLDELRRHVAATQGYNPVIELVRMLDTHITSTGDLPLDWRPRRRIPASLAEVRVDRALDLKCCIEGLAALPLPDHTEGHKNICSRCGSNMYHDGLRWRWMTPVGETEVPTGSLLSMLESYTQPRHEEDDDLVVHGRTEADRLPTEEVRPS